jgi:hypothetical protein
VGNLYVANEGNNTIEKYDSLGNGSLFATLPAGTACFGVALDVSNTVYVASFGFYVYKITNPGGVVSTFVSGLSVLDEPYGLVFDNARNLFVANGLGGWIEKIDTQTNATRFATPGHGPIGVTFDSAGNLYVGLSGPDQILKYDTLGNASTFVASLAHEPWGMVFDSSGNLYVAGESDSSIEKVTPQGNITVFANSSSGLFATAFLAIQESRYSDNWFKVAGGGGTGTNTEFLLNGTAGQQDAGTAMTGGQYGMVGGFWGRISVVQTPGAPLLTIIHTGSEAIVSWPPTVTGWTLQTNNNLATGTWGNYTGSVINNSVTNSSPTGNLFFRLSHP